MGAIDAAAKSLSDASYPFLKDIDWLSSIYIKPLPGASIKDTMKAIDKTIVMGSNMDGNILKAAAEAHHKAIGSIDAKGVTSQADYEAVNAALGKAIASVPKSQVMDVYNAFAKVVPVAEPILQRSLRGLHPARLWIPQRVQLWCCPRRESRQHANHIDGLFFVCRSVCISLG